MPPAQSLGYYLTCAIGLTLLLVVACAVKGEPPRWRWGDDDRGR